VHPFRRRRVVALGADDLFWTTGDVRADTERLRSLVGALLTEAAARWGEPPGPAVSGARRLG
jgi:hypothetical protein